MDMEQVYIIRQFLRFDVCTRVIRQTQGGGISVFRQPDSGNSCGLSCVPVPFDKCNKNEDK